jgi:Glycosyl hydrolases family 16
MHLAERVSMRLVRLLAPAVAAGLLLSLALLGGGRPPVARAASASPFTLVQDSEFNGTTLGSRWTVYDGKPRCCESTWAPGHARVSGGRLLLDATKATMRSAGVSLRHLNLTYGRWHVRMRMDAGLGIKMCALLWPQAGWPPEIDFAESDSADAARTQLSSTLHYGASNTQIRHHLAIDFTRWHTYGVTWTPGLVRYTVDGRTWAEVAGSMVPSQPMHFGIQTVVGTSNGSGSQPDASTPANVYLHIDFVKVWSYR